MAIWSNILYGCCSAVVFDSYGLSQSDHLKPKLVRPNKKREIP